MSIPIYNDAIEWAEIESRGRPYSPVDCQLNLSFGAIHTSSALLTQVLTRLSNEPHLITPLRQEIIEVLKAEGMNKNSLYDLKLMDSALKETQRIKPDQMLNLRRMATDNLVTSDGLEIKKGQRVAVDLGNMVDLKAYPEPEKFDIYRYYNMRQNPATAVKSQLVATSVDNLTFGHGNHACPGRFFAANEIKLALCHLLLKYDWELSPDASLEAIYPAAAMSMLDPNVQLRTPTPPAALPEAPWVAQTPSNARELEAQSSLIRERVRQHKSSSPASIIMAIDQLKKGAEVMMLSAELMRDRISSLEKANSAASERRRRSKRRIQKHGVLTKGAGEDILAQNEADQQIAHEERQGGARSGLSQRAQRRCTRCKETGHNSRTCKTDTINIE
ncbi:Cytochrome P450 [Pyrenophora tritici-repentis]|nr:Cytochrome P450 [Pyrenophora tritici-repentis]